LSPSCPHPESHVQPSYRGSLSHEQVLQLPTNHEGGSELSPWYNSNTLDTAAKIKNALWIAETNPCTTDCIGLEFYSVFDSMSPRSVHVFLGRSQSQINATHRRGGC
jgi:hypothetical protein